MLIMDCWRLLAIFRQAKGAIMAITVLDAAGRQIELSKYLCGNEASTERNDCALNGTIVKKVKI
jgi:hypothetical protein